MTAIELGFRAFDPHELLPYAIARRRRLFAEAGLEVRLRDLTFGPDESPQASCGAALLAALRGASLRVVLVASRAPLFWLVGRESEPLAGRRVASYPEGSPPALLARLLLGREVLLEPVRDDAARIGLVLSGDVAAAVVSSAEPPARLDAAGLRELASFADALRVPTTGLAVPEQLIGEPALEAVRATLRAALSRLAADPDEVARSLVEDFRYDVRSAERRAPALARAFSADGRARRAELEDAVALLAGALGVEPPPVEAIYAPTALSE